MDKKIETLNPCLENNPAYYLAYDREDALVSLLEGLSPDKVFLIVDSVVEQATHDSLFSAVSKKMNCNKIIFDSCENNKTFSKLNELCEEMIHQGVSKDSVIVAHGGGVVGNIAGLCASLIFRGIRFVEVPTTFIAQTDSTLSNKQAVNSSVGKNHFGTYYAPAFIFSDVKYLSTDDPSRIRDGVVETIKNALISDRLLIPALKNTIHSDGKYSIEELYHLVKLSVLSKSVILSKDPSEKGYAVILEYGHTVGHAIELLSGGRLHHGDSVAIGMIVAAIASLKLKVISSEDFEIVVNLIRNVGGLRSRIPEDITTERIIEAIHSDNKKTKNGVGYVLLSGIGEIFNPNNNYLVYLDDSLVAESIDAFRSDF